MSHPARAGLSTRVGRHQRGATTAFLAGYNAALLACCLEGADVLTQPVPPLQPDYIDGWRSGCALAQALGVRP